MVDKFSRRRFLEITALTGTSLAFGLDGEEPAIEPEKSNIVLIYPDQFRADTLGVMNHPVIRTPNLDSIAAEGVVFSRCFTAAPLCRPARASLFTGWYPSEHGVWGNDNVVEDPLSVPSHVRDIRDNGYCTALVGKTHLHLGKGHYDNHKHILVDWGFEEDHIVEISGPNEMCFIESAYSDYLGPEKYQRFKYYMDKYRRRNAKYNQWLTPAPDKAPWYLGTGDHADVYTGLKAAEWIRSYSNSSDTRPFYLQVCFPGPHDPFDAPTEWRELYDPEDPNIPLPATLEPPIPSSPLIDGAMEYKRCQDKKQNACIAEHVNKLHQLYYAKVELIDAAIGQVLSALHETGHYENTWIVFASDHGEMLGDHGMMGKIAFLENSINIPLIIRPPLEFQTDAGWHCEGLVDQFDMTVSLLEMAGLNPLGGHGQSLVNKVTTGPNAPDANQGKEFVISQVGPLLGGDRYFMIRTQTYKLVTQGMQSIELYDLENDPAEMENRVLDASLQDKRQELEAALRDAVLSEENPISYNNT